MRKAAFQPIRAGLLLSAALGLLLGGCTGGTARYAVVNRHFHGPTANLALGTTRLHPMLGREFNERSDWPAAYHGYIEDEVTYYADVRYDDQRFYDRYNGLQNELESTRLGVFRR